MNDDPLFFWRLHDEMSVPNAAILMVGGDPEELERVWDESTNDTIWAQKRTYPGFSAAFGALKGAIRRSEIKAAIAYHSADARGLRQADQGHVIVARRDLWEMLRDKSNDPFSVMTDGGDYQVQIAEEPDWERTELDTESLRRWLRSKNAVDGFFLNSRGEGREANELAAHLDTSHEHFSPDLALALSAWFALASEQKFPRGAKAAIEAWIDANPDAWLGEGPLSTSAKERIVTVVNWNRGGGAPRSGG